MFKRACLKSSLLGESVLTISFSILLGGSAEYGNIGADFVPEDRRQQQDSLENLTSVLSHETTILGQQTIVCPPDFAGQAPAKPTDRFTKMIGSRRTMLRILDTIVMSD